VQIEEEEDHGSHGAEQNLRLRAHCKLRQSKCARCLVRIKWLIYIYVSLFVLPMNATMTHPVDENNRHDDEQLQQQSVVVVVTAAFVCCFVVVAVIVFVLQ
jgi:hypothetical protein